MKTLVTGSAGFIGFHVAKRLLERGDHVVGFDVVDDYYDPELKEARLRELARIAAKSGSGYRFVRGDLTDRAVMKSLFRDNSFERVIHLAAQAGVRYSLVNPHSYIRSNVEGFLNVLEGCRWGNVPHLTYASTSSVYGASTAMPFSEKDSAAHPLALYAATKRANELMAHSYSHLYAIPTSGLRFFTVYGPWGRPDMALFIFTRKILAGETIELFNNGRHTRDFTYVDDIAEGVIRVSDQVACADPNWDSRNADPASSSAPFRIFNIGNSNPVSLLEYIEALEDELGRKSLRVMKPLQPGDVPDTSADVSSLERAVDYRPSTPVRVGVSRFVKWYREYYRT